MNSTIAQTFSSKHFKRRFGIQKETFKQVVKVLKTAWRPTPKPGAKPKLEIEERVLIALEYWREDRTYFHIGSSWGVSESTVCRIVRSCGRYVNGIRAISPAWEETASAWIWPAHCRGGGCDRNAD